MVEIGKYNTLEIVKEVDFGLYLNGGEQGEILLPKRYVPQSAKVGEELEVFIYLDSEDRIIATTETPYAIVGEFAYLEVVAVSKVGVFLDWGLPKDLMLPFREQKSDVSTGQKVAVFIYFDDESKRIVASAKLEKFLDNVPAEYEENQEVEVFIYAETEIGYKAVINDQHSGIIYRNEVFRKIRKGEHTIAYIKKIREDEKIDLILDKPGFEKIDETSVKILNYLVEQGGSSPLNDKSEAEEIQKAFGISKKTFKKAIGALYKKRYIVIEANGIRLSDDD